ncbi:glycoside hydrolase family 19 protein [Prescottella defluvii]|nr:glycoside hydrolase family 19 protein [Prescottella defluvii]
MRQAAFISQLVVESDSFRTFEEYASGSAYEGRSDLGNVAPGDGERYKGRGAIQVTGRHNYQSVSDYLGVDFIAHPELMSTPENAFDTAAWYWQSATSTPCPTPAASRASRASSTEARTACRSASTASSAHSGSSTRERPPRVSRLSFRRPELYSAN